MDDKNESQNKSTPPSTNRKVLNPFDLALIEKLHKPICSPGMCKIYKKKNSGTFRWDIDQACTLIPADFEACNSQFEPSPDPALEKIADEATDIYFSQEMVIPSPLITSSKIVKPLQRTSCDASNQMDSVIKEKIVVTREVSAQTLLTLPPELPPELELLLKPFYTFTQDQNLSGEYEITANGSLRRKLYFEEHSDMEHYDSEQTDDETPPKPRPPSVYEAHTRVVFSPDLSKNLVSKGMKRNFGTPLKKGSLRKEKPFYRNKILNVGEFSEPCLSPRGFRTPRRNDSIASTSLACSTVSPIVKSLSSDEECQEYTSKAMIHSFGTPLKEGSSGAKSCYQIKLLNTIDHTDSCVSPAEFRTPTRDEFDGPNSTASLGSACISPITKVVSSDEEKTNAISPDTEKMATCLDCVESRTKSEKCFCKLTPNKIKRSASLKDSPPRSRKASFSFSEKRSLSMSSLHRSRSVQKLDFSMDMSIDSSMHNQSQADSETSSPLPKEPAWSLATEASTYDIVKAESTITTDGYLEETPIRGRSKTNIRSHEISKIRASQISPLHMSLDNSLDCSLSLEDKKIDFNQVDLKLLTENISQFNQTANNTTKVGSDSSTSYRKIDSGFNENTFYANASSYYESAIKPSELTVTNISKSTNALKEISNVHWMRMDSGFKDECSSDATQFYTENDEASLSKKCFTGFNFSEAKLDNKENMVSEEFLTQTNKNEAMSMSDIFTDEVTFNCNFSSTPSKNKSRKVHS